jgi:hypothetical protein
MTPRTKKCFTCCCVVTVALTLGGVAWVAYVSCSVAIRAEYTLHAVNLATVVVDKYVEREGTWPASWDELATVSTVNHWAMYSWPEDREKVQSRVTVDFAADPATLAKQNVEEFDAIKPIGPSYPYKHDGHVAALLETLRKKTGGQREQVR